MADKTTTYMRRSPITGKTYDYFSKDYIRLINLKQIEFFMYEYGVMPVDIVITDDRKQAGKKIVVFIFKKSDTTEAWNSWIAQSVTKDTNM